MYCDLRSAIVADAIISKPPTTLRTLPAASQVTFPGAYAWSVVSSATVTKALGVDPGAWNTWRNRRIAPSPLPSAWFRRTTGQPCVYMVSDVLTWLATRNGEQLTTLDAWRLSLLRDFEDATSDPDQVRGLVVMYARAVGAVVGDVQFTPAGFQAYLTTLLSSK